MLEKNTHFDLLKSHMAEFTENFQNIIRPSFPFLDSDQSMELLNQFMENSNMNMMHNLMPFSCDSILEHHQQQEQEHVFPRNLEENFHGLVHHVNNQNHNAVHVSLPTIFQEENKVHHEGKKRKMMDFQETSSGNSTPAVSESGSKTKLVNFFYFFFSFYSSFFVIVMKLNY